MKAFFQAFCFKGGGMTDSAQGMPASVVLSAQFSDASRLGALRTVEMSQYFYALQPALVDLFDPAVAIIKHGSTRFYKQGNSFETFYGVPVNNYCGGMLGHPVYNYCCAASSCNGVCSGAEAQSPVY
jgi:hypothetical protein